MNWVFTGILLGSIVTSQHESKELCLGRKAMLTEKGVIGDCAEVKSNYITSGTTLSICTMIDNNGKCVR